MDYGTLKLLAVLIIPFFFIGWIFCLPTQKDIDKWKR